MAFNPQSCLCFINEGYSNVTISIGVSQVDGSPYYFSSDEGVTWVADSITIGNFQKAYCKGTAAPSTSASYTGFGFSCSDLGMQDIVLQGSVTSLIDDGEGSPDTLLSQSCFAGLFSKNNDSMGNFNLWFSTEPALLPSKNVPDNAYESMFELRNINVIPEGFLKGENLGNYCYLKMFSGVTGLIRTPKVLFSKKITSFGYCCFQELFSDCSQLEEIYLQFPDWDVAGDGTECFTKWVNNLNPTGTFYARTSLPDVRSGSRIPDGWTLVRKMSDIDTTKCLKFVNKSSTAEAVIKLNPSLLTGTPYYFTTDTDITDLWVGEITIPIGGSAYCFGTGFPSIVGDELNSLKFDITADKIKLEGSLMSLVDNGKGTKNDISDNGTFRELFYGATALVEITKDLLPAIMLGYECYQDLFYNTGISEIPAELLPATVLADYCYYSMFANTKVTKVPAGLLPATIIPDHAYEEMFSNCSELVEVEAGAIKATTMGMKSLGRMFENNSSLKKICVEFTSWNESKYSTINWVTGVTSKNGTFVCPAELAKTYDKNHIPEAWKPKEKKKGSLIFVGSIKTPISGDIEE